MAECTDLERALLDELRVNTRADIGELRTRIVVERITPEQWEQLFNLRAQLLIAQCAYQEAWSSATEGVAGNTDAFKGFYDRIEKEARKRAGWGE